MPSFLLDYTSFWNPLADAYLSNIMDLGDNCHGLKNGTPVGLHNLKPSQMIERGILIEYGAIEEFLPKNEKTLNVRGYVMFFFRTQTWIRVN